MINNNHPITPPPELVEQWYEIADNSSKDVIQEVATQAARWGADKQLEMDATWVVLQTSNQMSSKRLIAEMRPKPLSLKEQALALISHDPARQPFLSRKGIDTIRRALESIPDPS